MVTIEGLNTASSGPIEKFVPPPDAQASRCINYADQLASQVHDHFSSIRSQEDNFSSEPNTWNDRTRKAWAAFDIWSQARKLVETMAKSQHDFDLLPGGGSLPKRIRNLAQERLAKLGAPSHFDLMLRPQLAKPDVSSTFWYDDKSREYLIAAAADYAVRHAMRPAEEDGLYAFYYVLPFDEKTPEVISIEKEAYWGKKLGDINHYAQMELSVAEARKRKGLVETYQKPLDDFDNRRELFDQMREQTQDLMKAQKKARSGDHSYKEATDYLTGVARKAYVYQKTYDLGPKITPVVMKLLQEEESRLKHQLNARKKKQTRETSSLSHQIDTIHTARKLWRIQDSDVLRLKDTANKLVKEWWDEIFKGEIDPPEGFLYQYA